MKKLVLVVLLLFCLIDGALANENRTKGLKLAEERKYVDAMIVWKKAVEEGDGDSAALIGYLYQLGRTKEIPKNPEKALEWYQKAMDMGSPRARVHMAWLYVEGYSSISKDLSKAYELIKGLENSDDTFILNSVYRFYANGWGTTADFAKAREIASRIPNSKVKQDSLADIDAIELSSKTIPAQTLVAEVQQNQLRFDKNYKGKKLTIEGYVGLVDAKNKGYTLQLFGTKESLANPFSTVECRFNASQEDTLLELNRGQVVKIQGTYRGKEQFQLGAFVLLNCKVIK
jgi:tetratricopeptide (TPR) repeat protein